MKVWNGVAGLPADRAPVVASIGNYDGVHCGHQTILAQVVADAAERGLASALITFDPHPLTVVLPERRPDLVQTRGQKLRSLEAAGLDELLILRFDAALARLDGTAFLEQFLLPVFPVQALHVGENFHFGRARSGDVTLLKNVGAASGFAVNGVPAVQVNGHTVSSSVIRECVRRGEITTANELLGRPFALTGLVARGAARGRRLGFPTANLEPDNMLIPRAGVYLTEVRVLSGSHPAMTNVGLRPTFGGEQLSIETHILDFDEELYGQRIEVLFLERLRDEQAFESPTVLADQLARDRAAAESYFSGLRLRLE